MPGTQLVVIGPLSGPRLLRWGGNSSSHPHSPMLFLRRPPNKPSLWRRIGALNKRSGRRPSAVPVVGEPSSESYPGRPAPTCVVFGVSICAQKGAALIVRPAHRAGQCGGASNSRSGGRSTSIGGPQVSCTVRQTEFGHAPRSALIFNSWRSHAARQKSGPVPDFGHLPLLGRGGARGAYPDPDGSTPARCCGERSQGQHTMSDRGSRSARCRPTRA